LKINPWWICPGRMHVVSALFQSGDDCAFFSLIAVSAYKNRL
jgi:hypothetical protein